MNIAGPLVQGIAEQKIDKLDNRRFPGAFFKILDILLVILYEFNVFHLGHEVIDIVIVLAVVAFLTNRFDIVRGAHDDINRHTGLSLDIVNGKNIGWLCHRHQQRAVLFDSDGHHMIAPDIFDVYQ